MDQKEDLQRYYKDRDVVGAYMSKRTGEPLNGVLHRRQVAFLNQTIADSSPRSVLEVACGPGRLTAAIRGVPFGAAVDSSPEMLRTARHRVGQTAERWSFLRSDAFVLPFAAESFDMLFTLRFVRHFQFEDRARLYREFRRVLRPDGLFVVDGLNRRVSYPYRLRRGLDRYPIYDVLYDPGELEGELREAGFKVLRVEGVLKYFSVQRALNRLRRVGLGPVVSPLIASLEWLPGENPNTWMIVSRKET